MERAQSKFFKDFVEKKRFAVGECICLLDDCAKKLEVLEDYVVFRTHDEDFVLNERMAEGLGRLLCDIGTDIRLISEDMTIEVHERMAKREHETKKRAPGKEG